MAFALLLLGLSLHEWRIFVNPVTIFLGRISFSIYLVHFFFLLPISYAWEHEVGPFQYFPPDTVLTMAVVYLSIFLPTVLVSMLTYRFIEKPGIRLGQILIERRETTAIPDRL